MAAIFDFRLTQTAYSLLISLFVLPAFENMSLPSESRCYHVYKLRFVKLHFFSAAILDFWLPVSSGSVTDSTIDKFDPENMGIAVGILLLASIEAEIV